MAALVRTKPLDLGDALPEAARVAIRQLLADDPRASRRVYAALARKIWSLLIERRFDPEIRDWHSLLNAVKAKVRSDDAAAAERITALADLLHESINLAEISPAREMAERPRARAVLEQLAQGSEFVRRRVLLQSLGIGSSNLTNVLTQLAAHNLVERRGNGKEAEFRLTRLGRELISGDTGAASAGALPAEANPLEKHIACVFQASTMPPASEHYWFVHGGFETKTKHVSVFDEAGHSGFFDNLIRTDEPHHRQLGRSVETLLGPTEAPRALVFSDRFFERGGTKRDRMPAHANHP
jgi:predicted transcriptional regulator